jgi:hypothetical protein
MTGNLSSTCEPGKVSFKIIGLNWLNFDVINCVVPEREGSSP